MKLFSAMVIVLFLSVPFSFAADTNGGMQNEMESFLKEKEDSRKAFNRMKGATKKNSDVDEKKSAIQFEPPVHLTKIAPVVPAYIAPEPVAEYLFSGNGEDSSGQGNNAVVFGALPTPDRNGSEDSAYIFYERAHRIKIPLTAANTFSTGSFTVSFWIRTKDNGGAMKELLTNNTGSSASLWGFNLTPDGALHFQLKNQGGQSAFIVSPINDWNWHQVTGVRNAENNTMSLYVDGTLIQTREGVTGSVDSGGDIFVGDHLNRLFVGRIDDIRIWGEALNNQALGLIHSDGTCSPVVAIQNTEIDDSPGIPEPVGMYMFSGNAQDGTVNQNHGIVTGAELIEDRAGNFNSAYLFYSRPHRIKIPLTPQNTFSSGSFTVSFWVKTQDKGSVIKNIVTNDSGSKPCWSFNCNAQGLIFRLTNQEGDSAYLTYPVNDGAWHHVIGTRNATNNTMSLYVDSTIVETRTAVTGSVNSLGDIFVGDHKNRLFSGRIDDVILWDMALSEAKMVELHTLAANLPLTVSFSPDADNKQEPVGQYHFDGDASDSSAEHNDGIVTAAHLSQDKYGNENKAYCFYERNNRIKIPLIPANTFARGSFTISFKFKVNETLIGNMHGLVTNDTNSRQKWGIFYTSSKALVFVIHDKEDQYAMISHPIELGAWYTVIAVRDAAANTISMYLDSHLVETRPGASGDLNSGDPIWVGEHTNLLFRGCIDEVVLWRRALGAQEISDMNKISITAPIAVPLDNKILFEKKGLNKQHLLPKK
ncbi:MAG: LamG domain-containing protein [Proteobacteria bacterium]|nr:LamG domain-containing protein [Pseudomonadota bacterium]